MHLILYQYYMDQNHILTTRKCLLHTLSNGNTDITWNILCVKSRFSE